MKRFAWIFVCGLLAGLTACAGRNGAALHRETEKTSHVVTTWGASSPDTELKWTYTGQPSPPFEGTPERALTEICFDLESTELDREARGALRTAAERLIGEGSRADLDGVALLVVGFADGGAERARADELGLRRAEAAKAQLVTLGIPKDQIQVSSYGARFSEAAAWERDRMKHERSAIIWTLE
jgi:outer membrane protein OmpA-like peptidoglycan-associated protein